MYHLIVPIISQHSLWVSFPLFTTASYPFVDFKSSRLCQINYSKIVLISQKVLFPVSPFLTQYSRGHIIYQVTAVPVGFSSYTLAWSEGHSCCSTSVAVRPGGPLQHTAQGCEGPWTSGSHRPVPRSCSVSMWRAEHCSFSTFGTLSLPEPMFT